LILSGYRRSGVLLSIPKKVRLVILRIHTRNIFVIASWRVVMICRLAAIFVNIE
jgi:hypothetical protein